MKIDELSKQKMIDILHVLDDLLDKSSWDESNFIRAIGKNLREIREEFGKDIDKTSDKTKITTQVANRMALRSGQQEVFIALYSSDGGNLASWEKIISTLPRQVVSRPIYADEENVRKFIRSKENKVNEAYLAIYIDQNDLLSLPPDKTPLDKLGIPLLSLKDKTLNLDNIDVFVHQSGVYHCINGRLVKKN